MVNGRATRSRTMPDISSMFPVTRLADRYNRKASIAITSRTTENIPVNTMMKMSRTIGSNSMTPPGFWYKYKINAEKLAVMSMDCQWVETSSFDIMREIQDL